MRIAERAERESMFERGKCVWGKRREEKRKTVVVWLVGKKKDERSKDMGTRKAGEHFFHSWEQRRALQSLPQFLSATLNGGGLTDGGFGKGRRGLSLLLCEHAQAHTHTHLCGFTEMPSEEEIHPKDSGAGRLSKRDVGCFISGRVKRIMQEDDDVGKVSAEVPAMVGLSSLWSGFVGVCVCHSLLCRSLFLL